MGCEEAWGRGWCAGQAWVSVPGGMRLPVLLGFLLQDSVQCGSLDGDRLGIFLPRAVPLWSGLHSLVVLSGAGDGLRLWFGLLVQRCVLWHASAQLI